MNVLQALGEQVGIEGGLALIAAIVTAGIFGVLALMQYFTRVNIYNILAKVNGIGLISIGSSAAVLYAVQTDSFELVRAFAAPVATLLIVFIAVQADDPSSVIDIYGWLTVDDALRAVIVGGSVVVVWRILIDGASSVSVADYLTGFPIAGIAILVFVTVVAVRNEQSDGG
jgi:hypothetical protein